MKKNISKRSVFALFTFLLFTGILNAQDYRVFEWNAKHLYEGVVDIKGIMVDSSDVSGSDSVFYNFFSINDTAIDSNYCVNVFSPSWFGRKILIPTDSLNILFNYANDSIIFRPLDPVGSTWKLYEFWPNHIVEASVTNVYTQDVNGVPDSIKEITLFEKNNSIIVPGPITGRILKLSQHHGFIQLMPFRDFPGDTSNFIMNDSLFLTNFDVYNFDVGDTFQYVFYTMYPYNTTVPPYNSRAWAITGKTVSADTATYSIWQQIIYHTVVYDSAGPHLETTVYDTTFARSYIISNTPIYTTMPEETYFIGQQVYSYIMRKHLYYYNICNVVEAIQITGAYYFDSTMMCVPAPFESVIYYLEYARGLGITNSNQVGCIMCGDYSYYNYLSSYHKVNSSCGSIYIINSINDNILENRLSIYPNPISGSDYFNVSISDKQAMLTITEMTGKKLLTKKLSRGVSAVDSGFLLPGIYVCRIEFEDGVSLSRTIIK